MRFILLLFAFSASVFAQNLANVVVNPRFIGLDQNGAPVSLGKLCSYAAGTTSLKALYADAGGVTQLPDPVILDAGGQGAIYGNGNYKLVLQNPGDSNCPGTGSIIWSTDNVFFSNQNPTFGNVVATTFNSTATGSTAAFQQQSGTVVITGAGNVTAQTYTGTTTFNSLSTGTTSAFQTGTGSFEVFGSGNFQGQQANVNQGKFTGFTGVPSATGCASCDVPAAGSALLYYDTTLGTLRYNLGGAGWLALPSVAGTNTQVQYNNAGVLGASSHLTFAGDNLTLGGGTSTGVVAPVFNSTNTGSNNAFQTAGGTMYIHGAGDAGFQRLTAGAAGPMALSTGTGSNTDTSGIVTLSGGVFTLNWPSGRTYTTNPICVGNDFTANHSVSLGASTTQLVFSGTGSDQIEFLCVGGVF